jgi:putative sigma-54 modulation protein
MSRKSKALAFVNEDYDISVTGRNVLVTESMKDYALEKISKIDRFSTRVIDINILMDVQKLDHRVDIILKVNQVKIKSHAVSDNMYASIDLAVDRLMEQIRKYKSRLQDHHCKSVKDIDMNVNVLQVPQEDEVTSVNKDIEDENQRQLYESFRPHEVINKETRPLKILNTSEAITKLELSRDVFLIYRCEEDKKLKVIYRRNDGNFGIIEPEQ